MFSTCVARGIAAKLVYKTVGGLVETSLFCSAPSTAAAAASTTSKQGRKRPDNERRRMRRDAWLQRKNSSNPAASTAAAFTAAQGEVAVSSAEAVAATAVPYLHMQAKMQLAAHGAAAVDTEAVPDRPPQAWAWEPRKRLVVVARRVLESPEIVREPDVIGDLNLSLCLMEGQETETADFSEKQTGSPTYATATAKQIGAGNTAASIPAAAAPATEEDRGEAVAPVYRPPPTPPCTTTTATTAPSPATAAPRFWRFGDGSPFLF